MSKDHTNQPNPAQAAGDWADVIAAEKLPCVLWNGTGCSFHQTDCPTVFRPAVAAALREAAATLAYGSAPTEARIMFGKALYPDLNGDAPEGMPNTLWAFAKEAARQIKARAEGQREIERLERVCEFLNTRIGEMANEKQEAEQHGYKKAIEDAASIAHKAALWAAERTENNPRSDDPRYGHKATTAVEIERQIRALKEAHDEQR